MASFLEAVYTALASLEALGLKGGLRRWFSFQPIRDSLARTAVGGTGLEFGFVRVVHKGRVLEVLEWLSAWLFWQTFFFHVFFYWNYPFL